MINEYVFDIECNGLLDNVTTIHCATFLNINREERMVFGPDRVGEIPNFMNNCDLLVGHNIIGYDLKVLKKLYNYEHKGKIRDTLLMSRVLVPDIAPPSYEHNGKRKTIKGKHSIAAWACRFEDYKIEHEDWSQFSDNMLQRNIKDTEIGLKLYKYFLEYMENMQKKDKRLHNWDKIYEMEQFFWIQMEIAADTGWLLNTDLLFDLEKDFNNQLKEIDDQLLIHLPLRVVVPYNKPCQAFKKDGSLTSNALSWVGVDHSDNVLGDFSRVKFEQMNLGSDAQLKDFLLKNSWTPVEYNFKKDDHGKPIKDENGKIIYTSPKLPKTEEDWELVEDDTKVPSISLLARRAKLVHRLGLVKGYIENMRSDKRLPSEMITVGCSTQRTAHRVIANVPRAEEGVFYGKEMRSLFICPSDRILVGCDASALEARAEAHYLFPFSKADALLLIEGDIHSLNAELWGVKRKTAKAGKYALSYGCAPAKLAKTLGKPLEQAKELYDLYWQSNPAAKQLKLALERQWEKWGYLVGIDGRPLTIRYKHALLNTLLQSCGIILMKIAFCFAVKEIKKRNLDAKQLCHYHDEYTFECSIQDADEVMKISEQSITKAGEYLKMNVPFIGEAKKGKSWCDVH